MLYILYLLKYIIIIFFIKNSCIKLYLVFKDYNYIEVI